ncbi:MAG: hypothetical protein H7X95_12870 [Deltaproteobacteria bacterium]|nr:hypothetical protein [Deltaproteobacteria bacterium]
MIFAGAYLGASGGRLRQHSAYNHYVYLADSWLHGRLSLPGPPPNENDWAKVDVLTLRDGRTIKGTYGGRGGAADRFYPLRGQPETVTPANIVTRTTIRYVSFPPLPAVLMAPFVAVWKLNFNDVLFTVLWAAVNPVLLFLLLRMLARRGLSRRSSVDDLWLTVMFGVGSVYYYCSVVGQVWFTAHVIAVTTVIGFAWAALDARRPALAGLFVGLGLATRPPGLGFMSVFFIWEAVCATGVLKVVDGKRIFRPNRAFAAKLVRFALPLVVVLIALAVHNWVRFAEPFEFGHRYLNVQWQERIQRYGLFNYHFLSRNLVAALVLLPRVLTKWPYIKISQHGMSLLLTSPSLAYTVMPAARSRLMVPLWLTVAATALPSLLYQNSGYVQLGYRFSLDYMIFLMMILAVGDRPLSRLWKSMIVVSIPINLFLAIVFDRYMEFSYDDSFFPHGFN